MSIFDNLEQVQVFENSAYFQPGKYLVEIVACKFVQGYKGESFVIETRVIATTSDHKDAPKPGQIAAQVWNATGDKREIARSTWLAFLCGVLKKQKADFTGAELKALSAEVIDDNKLQGLQTVVDVFTKPTQSGGIFTHHKWLGAPTDEQKKEFGIA